MADREQSPASNRGSVPKDEKQQRDAAGTGGHAMSRQYGSSHQTGSRQGGPGDRAKEGDLAKDRGRTLKSGGTVGRDVPEHSYAKDTEVAVEAGRKDGEHGDDKR
jgi:hypothetical protein